VIRFKFIGFRLHKDLRKFMEGKFCQLALLLFAALICAMRKNNSIQIFGLNFT
jgi:hypothetical protein